MGNQTKKEVCIRAVDIGGNGFRRGDVYGRKVDRKSITVMPIKEINISNPKEALSQLKEFAWAGISSKTEAIAYSVAGVIENHNKVKLSPNAHFLDRLKLAGLTIKETSLPSCVANDMEAAVTGMAALLAKEKYFMGITWSSGIGARIWVDGHILSPAEVGHMVLDPSLNAPICGCGKRGHAEAIIGGDVIKGRVMASGIKIPENMPPCAFLDQEYQNQKKWAVDMYETIGTKMGIFLANIQTCFCLPLIVWKGKFALKALKLKGLESCIRKAMSEVLIDPDWASPKKLRFKPTPGPEDKDALIGAARISKSIKS